MDRKDIIFGLLVGIVSSIIGALLYALVSGMLNGISIQDIINNAFANNLISKLFSLGSLLNLSIFFLFLRQRKDNKAKGVLIATLFIAFISIVNKLL